MHEDFRRQRGVRPGGLRGDGRPRGAGRPGRIEAMIAQMKRIRREMRALRHYGFDPEREPISEKEAAAALRRFLRGRGK